MIDSRTLSLFTETMLQFMEYVRSTFADDEDVARMARDVQLLARCHPQKLYQFYWEFIYAPLQIKIGNCDDSFVQDLSSILKGTEAEGSFGALPRLWTKPENTDITKATVYQYLIKMGRLCQLEK